MLLNWIFRASVTTFKVTKHFSCRFPVNKCLINLLPCCHQQQMIRSTQESESALVRCKSTCWRFSRVWATFISLTSYNAPSDKGKTAIFTCISQITKLEFRAGQMTYDQIQTSLQRGADSRKANSLLSLFSNSRGKKESSQLGLQLWLYL